MFMNFADPGRIRPEGDLGRRLMLSGKRLSNKIYTYPDSFNDGNGWPGDWPGRAMLGQILLSRTAGEENPALTENLAHLPELFNEKGYVGPVSELPDEQQLSGNSWMLRALCELYEWKNDPAVLTFIQRMIKNLYIPLAGKYAVYPNSKVSRILGTGAEAGQTTGEIVNGWVLSSDIGCSFIPLDGMTHAFRVTGNQALAAVIREAIAAFESSDLTAATFQTHATLSATRGILRFFEDTGEDALLRLAKRVFDYYLANGMTENYANLNWFGRPEWTEPCAIVDSFMCAMQLYAITGTIRYLETAELIYNNALSFAQRPNGGFGCDCCAGEALHPSSEGAYEAMWCCTMRGGEGLSRAAQYAAGFKGKDVYLNLLFPGEYDVGPLKFSVQTRYPYDGLVSVKVLRVQDNAVLHAYAPYPTVTQGFRQDGNFMINEAPLKEGDEIFYRMYIPLFRMSAMFVPGKETLRYGRLILGYDGAGLKAEEVGKLNSVLGGSKFVDGKGHVFVPLSLSTYSTKENILKTSWQILF